MGKKLPKILISLLACAAFSGCVVLLPFIENQTGEGTEGNARYAAAFSPAARAQPKQRLTRFEKERRLLSRYVYNLGHQDAVVRIHAASHLGEMGSAAREAVDPLIRSLHDPHYWVRRTAAKSLGKIGDPRAVDALVERMRRDSDRYVSHSAANALRRIGTPRALAAVQGRFN